jgi:hypothetical protein
MYPSVNSGSTGHGERPLGYRTGGKPTNSAPFPSPTSKTREAPAMQNPTGLTIDSHAKSVGCPGGSMDRRLKSDRVYLSLTINS